MKRLTLALVFAVVAMIGATTPKSVSAQEILLEGPLAGAPAVKKMVQYRQLRFSVGPQFAYTILNDYQHNFLIGARIEFNILDWLGIGLVGYFGLNAPTKLTQHIVSSRDIGQDKTTPTDSNWPSYTGAVNFESQLALLKGIYLAQLNLVPFRGKMSMFERLFVAIDGSIFLGGGIVHFQERTACDGSETGGNECGEYWGSSGFRQAKDNISDLEATREDQIGGAFTVGLGFMAYFNDWFAVNLEFRITPFMWNSGGTDESGAAASTWQYANDGENNPVWEVDSSGSGDYPDHKINKDDRAWNPNMSIGLGFIFYFPLAPTIDG